MRKLYLFLIHALVPSGLAAQLFLSVTNAVTLHRTDSYAVGWGDFDRDGNEDLFFANKNRQTNSLFRNLGGGSFQRVTSSTNGTPVSDPADSEGCAWGDYDNDGYLDLFVANYSNQKNFLYHNNGGASWTKQSSLARGTPGGDPSDSIGCAWSDYDRDGLLDLFVANHNNQFPLLYRNRGDGTFLSITNAMTRTRMSSWACEWGDLNNDGWPDLVAAQFNARSAIYLSQGVDDFARVEEGDLAQLIAAVNGVALGDFDNDGDLDVAAACGGYGPAQPNRLFVNNGFGTLARDANQFVGDIGTFTGAAWGDCDNDGDLDLFVTNLGGRNLLYLNNGEGRLLKAPTSAYPSTSGGTGCSWGDFNMDGHLDLVISGGPSRRNALWKCTPTTNQWLKVRLVGTRSNRAGIGARILASARIGGKTIRQLREIGGGSGYTGQNSLTAHFGLGEAAVVNQLTVIWTTGEEQHLSNVAAGQVLTIVEPPAIKLVQNRVEKTLLLHGLKNASHSIEITADLKKWLPWTEVSLTHSISDPIQFTNSTSGRFFRASVGVTPF